MSATVRGITVTEVKPVIRTIPLMALTHIRLVKINYSSFSGNPLDPCGSLDIQYMYKHSVLVLTESIFVGCCFERSAFEESKLI